MSENEIVSFILSLPSLFRGEKSPGLEADIQLILSGTERGNWVIAIRDQKCSVYEGIVDTPRLILNTNAQDAANILSGELDAGRAFMSGKLSLSGDLFLARKLPGYFKATT